MAFNFNALKGLFGRLKPAAKTVANYGDDVAGAVAKYGDDTAKALTTYGDDAARMAFANADDLAAATAQTDDIAKRIRDVDAPVLWDSNNVPDGLDFDIFEVSDDNGLSAISFPINGARNPVAGSSDELISYLNNADAEFDSFSQLDPNAYKSGLDGTPDLNSTHIDPLKFPGYSPQLVDSFTYPDGFYDPDGAAMYYDSLERGYIPEEYDYVDYFSHAEPAYHPVHGQVRKRIDNQVSNRITHNTHAPAKTSMDVNNPVHRGILDDYYEYLSSYPKNITPRDPVFLSKYPYRYHYPWEGKY